MPGSTITKLRSRVLEGRSFRATHTITIRKIKAGYRLVSKKGKNLGTYKTKDGAKQRERQVQYFKKAKGK